MTTAAPIMTPQAGYTPEDLLTMPDGKHYELINGQLRDTTMSHESSEVASELIYRLKIVTKQADLGGVYDAQASYQCLGWDSTRVYRPDVSFIHRDRFTRQMNQGHVRIAPDLAAEVISPNDLAQTVREKIADYPQAGVRLTWFIYPSRRSVDVYRADGSTASLGPGDMLDGEDVVPGFQCPVAELFPTLDTAK